MSGQGSILKQSRKNSVYTFDLNMNGKVKAKGQLWRSPERKKKQNVFLDEENNDQ